VPAALAVALTVVACSLDDIAGKYIDIGIDDGASDGAKESLKVDGSQEQRLELETGATLTLPKGAVDHDVTIGVERPSDTKAIEFVETLKTVKAVASAPYVLTPHGTEFAKDIKLEIPVVNNKGKNLVAAYLKDENDREWKYLDTPTVENDVATVTLKHFSVIVLLDRERAGFEIEEPADAPDAGAARDAGSARDASTSEEDAGAELDAGTDTDPGADRDAGKNEAPDASAGGAIDAGVGASSDSGAQATPDASVSVPVDAASDDDSGASQVSDGGTGQGTDSSATLPDGALDPDATTGASVDSGQGSDTGVDAGDAQLPDGAADACQPHVCEIYECGSVPDIMCGGEVGCGNCEEYGGVCGMYEPNICGFPID
jgi:hypothetical protein